MNPPTSAVAPPGESTVAPTAARRALAGPLVVAGATILATAGVLLVNPAVHTIIVCPLRALTGLACPVCGCLRATADLAHGDVAAAWSMNPLWVIAVPLLLAYWVNWLWRSWRGLGPRRISDRTWQVIAVVLVVFGVVRNLPGMAAWLGPAS